MGKLSVEEMLEAGLHFGHQTFRWHPKMKPYIFDARDGIHIIDLVQTEEKLKAALDFAAQLSKQGGNILLWKFCSSIRTNMDFGSSTATPS